MIRLLQDDRLEWLDAEARTVRRGSAEEFSGAKITVDGVLVPTEAVFVSHVTIPVKQRQKLLQAAPFAIEDQLVGDLDSYHVAVGHSLGDNQHLVVAVAHEQMQRWTDLLEEAGISAKVMLPDALAIQSEDDTAVVIGDVGRALIRYAASGVFAGAASEVAGLLKMLAPKTVTTYGQVELGDSFTVEAHRPKAPAFQFLGEVDVRKPAVNLLQGRYGVRAESGSNTGRVWRWAAILGVLALGMATANLAIEYARNRNSVEELEAFNRQTLKETFTNVERLDNPRERMEQELNILRRESGQGGSTGLLALLRLAGPVIAQHPDVSLQSLNYRRGDLICDFRAPELPQIEALRMALNDARLNAELQSTTTVQGRAETRMRITRGGS